MIEIDISNIKNGLGSRLHITSPFDNLDFGFSWQRGNVSSDLVFNKLYGGVGEQKYNIFNSYVDLKFNDFFINPEYTILLYSPADFYIHGMSIQAGYQLFQKISFNIL